MNDPRAFQLALQLVQNLGQKELLETKAIPDEEEDFPGSKTALINDLERLLQSVDGLLGGTYNL
jgi:hypothetical protein